MRIKFGMNKGEYSETLFFMKPEYTRWTLFKSNAEGPLVKLREDMMRKIRVFDKKRLTVTCDKCEKRAEFAMVTGDILNSVRWRCGNCECDGPRETTRIIERYIDCLFFSPCDDDCVAMIRELASAKGIRLSSRKDMFDFWGKNNRNLRDISGA